jgi:type IV pilus assembly protein PilV
MPTATEIAAMVNVLSSERGFSMIEVLVSIVIVAVGLLGMAGLSARTTTAEYEAYQRAQALILLSDMVDKINANRKAAGCYAISDPSSGSPALGTGSTLTPACNAYGTAAEQARAVADLTDWNNKLLGAAETQSGNAVGVMTGARGCVSLDPLSNTYQVAVAWQGMAPTVAPTSVDATWLCGAGLYGPDSQRRLVSITLSIANLR